MTKKEVIWLLIRLAGLWFLWQSVEYAVALSSTYLLASQQPEVLAKSTWVFPQMVLQVGVRLALGLYCLGSGNVFFHLLSREEPADGDSDSTGTSTLGLP